MGARVLVVGGSPQGASPEVVRRAAQGCDAVVAVDRGLDAVLAAGLICDLFCGDADTVRAFRKTAGQLSWDYPSCERSVHYSAVDGPWAFTI